MKKYLKALLGVLIASSMLCGCGALDNLTVGKTAKTTQEVIENYNSLESNDNVQMDAVIDMFFGVSAEGLSMEIPMNIQLSMEAFDSKHGHATMNMKASLFGQSSESSMEIYTVDDMAYAYDSDYDKWVAGDLEDLEISMVDIGELQDKFFENAAMEYDKKEKVYTVTQSYSDFTSSGILDDVSDASESMMGSMDIEDDAMTEALEKAKVVYTFDKDYRLLSVKTVGLEYTGPVESDGQTAEVQFKMDISITYSRYGEIKESDVAVPDEVKASATEMSNAFNFSDDLTNGTSGIDVEGFNTTPDDTFGGYDDDNGYTFEDNTELRTDITYGEFKELPDVYGSYNGINLTCEGDSWASTFGADGWDFISQDNEYSFLVASNSKYGDNCELYLYTEDYDWTESGYDGVTADIIKSEGIYGYSIDLSYSESSVRPNMTWNGITFGASAQDLVSVYGEPSYYYEGSSYEVYSYSVELDDWHTMELEFYIYKDGQGLLQVSVQKY